ncbi:MAG: hypothetical protein GY807_03430 [Gammaproteobacteria bacterium]|nr:hypothetical protein [Gammaproteobacteria bacterium]
MMMTRSIKETMRQEGQRRDYARRHVKGWTAARHFMSESLRLVNENNVRKWIPSMPQFRALKGKYFTGKRFFIEADPERRLLIGSLGWFPHPEHPQGHPQMMRVPTEVKFSALWEIQKKIGQVCLDEGLYWRIIIDPSFAEDAENWAWLWYQAPEEEPPPPVKEPLPAGPVRTVTDTAYYLTRPPYPVKAWPDDKPYYREVGEGKLFHCETLSQTQARDGQIEQDDHGKPLTFRRMPFGVLPTHILDTLYAIYRATGSPLVAFWNARELVSTFGYAYGEDSRKRIADCLWDMFHTKLSIVDPRYRQGLDISPFAGCSLWTDTPANIDTIGRRNWGRTKKTPEGQSYLFSSFVLLSPAFLRWCEAQRQYELDWQLLNQIKGKEKQWHFYRKAVELGRRHAGSVPLGGKYGLLAELGYDISTTKLYTEAKHRFKKVVKALNALTKQCYGRAFACPHNVTGDQLNHFPWRPLKQHRQPPESFPIPSATTEMLKDRIDPAAFEAFRCDAMAVRRERLIIEEAPPAQV